MALSGSSRGEDNGWTQSVSLLLIFLVISALLTDERLALENILIIWASVKSAL